ncbi:glycosyltransferase family 4 protein [Duganella sp. HH105]|uniref:glycosyltransferase family 4 protein n=1 Tax=Duganella sp. HH105 TaxID=1781067 RepID=UPI0008940575|nr:glycosyltransferase family 4 protein [Duganella sp. HH105]OEZ61620.1 glycosyl transferases group 1 [Duganella sp. HH105]
MISKKKCLVVVFLPVGQLARYPDQMARLEFLRDNYLVSTIITSSNTGLAELAETRFIEQKNPLLFSLELARLLRKLPVTYDFIYVIGLPAVIAFALYRPKRPLVVYAPTHFEQHFGVDSKRGMVSRLAARLKQRLFFIGMRRTSSVMAISRQLAALYQDSAPRVRMIPMGVDLQRYAPRLPGTGTTRLNIIYPGSGGAGRGIDLLVACAKLARERRAPVMFHLVGCNDELLQQALAQDPGLAEVIHVYPLMAYAQVVELYQRMDAGISLLEHNKFYSVCPPQKIFEYMAAGLPVICNVIPTHTDYVADNAVMVEWDAEALYEGVLKMFESYPQYAAAAARAIADLEPFSHVTVEHSFVDEINRVCA